MVDGSRPIAIDLFCGAGGLSEGLRQAGFHTVAAVDFDRTAIATFAANHPETQAILADIAMLTGDSLRALADGKEIDLIAGGPSCQGFSTHGKRRQDDPRNFLFEHFVRLVSEVRPKFVLMENVKGLLTYGQGHFKTRIEQAFRDAGYRTISSTLCAADFGVPQLRHRVFFIGTRLSDAELAFPKPTHGPGRPFPHVTVGEAIGDLPLLGTEFTAAKREYARPPYGSFQEYARFGQGRETTLHDSGPLSGPAASLAAHIGQGEGLRAVPQEFLPGRFKIMRTVSNGELRRDCTTLYHRLHPDKPSYTITTHYRNVAAGPFLHPWEDRSLSHREAARLMSFPDRYYFVAPNLKRQIGNAVPPILARAMGNRLLEMLAAAESAVPLRAVA
jgi:DNA (cytosine-5)-methyltransferase 1